MHPLWKMLIGIVVFVFIYYWVVPFVAMIFQGGHP